MKHDAEKTKETLMRSWAIRGTWSEQSPLLEGRVGPAARPLMAIGRADDNWETILHWDDVPSCAVSFGGGEYTLALTIAIEDRDQKRLELLDGITGDLLAELPILCADPYQMLSIPLSGAAVQQIERHGLRLRLVQGERPLWLFAPTVTAHAGLESHLPRLVRGSFPNPESAFLDVLGSMASIQTFSWKEGCILDGLWELGQHFEFSKYLQVMRQHLDDFGMGARQLVYETPRNQRVRNQIYGIEGTLPFAFVARVEASHPWVELSIDFWTDSIQRYGLVCDPWAITAEGAYTVAYPMAVVGTIRGNDELIVAAKHLLLETYARLVRPDGIYLRHLSDESRTFRNWARGVAWLLLGHVQTLRVLPKSDDELVAQFVALATRIETQQLPSGLWACYTDEPDIAPDAAGSAGIAAALALGVRAGLLPLRFETVARRAFERLCQQLTAEGFLAGCAQSNKGGEALQRSDYRVISPYALGLMGLLYAALRTESVTRS